MATTVGQGNNRVRDLDSPKSDRGRTAEIPQEIPAAGWLDILLRVKKEVGSDNVSLVAGGLAMYALLAVFPGLAAAVSIYGLFATPKDVIEHLHIFAGGIAAGRLGDLSTQLQGVVARQQSTLSAAAAAGLLVSFWSARSGMAALITATNIAYSEREKRGFFGQILRSLGFTVGVLAALMVMLLLGVAVPLVV